jgi:hypothetical protein
MFFHFRRNLLTFFLMVAITGCGGGGSAGTPTNPPTTAATTTASPTPTPTPTPMPTPSPEPPAAAAAPMTMSCVGAASYQCSGTSVIRIDNGIGLTNSGVQAEGKSTNDLQTPIVDTGKALGLMPASGGTAEIRIAKDANGAISGQAVLLSNFNISWDGITDRPQIIETFSTVQGRITMDANGAISLGPLPPSSDLGFYDFAVKRAAGTKSNYANNAYFPRAEPSRCTFNPCPSIETAGLHNTPGNWHNGGRDPDIANAIRLHEDGDTYAGDDTPDADGNRRWLPRGDGFGVSFPGFKGYRSFENWGYQYGNLAAWLTQDTVLINEWGGNNEHNKNRRGMVAFGKVTDPATVPTAGSASYFGYAYGWYVPNGTEDVAFFRGDATVNVNFATREVTIAFRNTATYDAAWSPVPLTLDAATTMGAPGQAVANYLTGTAGNGTLAGGISGRWFGPVVTSGSSGAGPAEVGGAFTLSNAGSGQTAIGGFIARNNRRPQSAALSPLTRPD